MAQGSAPGERRGGRKKGTPNRITFDLLQILRDKGFEPVAELVKVHTEAMKLYYDKMENHKGWGAGPALDTAQKCASDIMEYVYPKRKAIEVTGKDGENFFQSFTDLVREIASEKK